MLQRSCTVCLLLVVLSACGSLTPQDRDDRKWEQLFDQYDEDGDQQISLQEHLLKGGSHFEDMDINGNGFVTLDEFKLRYTPPAELD